MDQGRHTSPPSVWSLVPGLLISGLLVVAACGAPDEIRRVSQSQLPGGNTAGSSAQGGSGGSGGAASSSTSAVSTGGATHPVTGGNSGSTGGRTGAGGGAAGGATGGAGGRGGSATGGATRTGGSVGGGGSTRTGGATGGAVGSGGRTSPFGGSTGAGGATRPSTGGTGGGAEGGSTATPPPTNGLGVYVVDPIAGKTGAIDFNLRIDNKTAQQVDMSAVSLRYWYQDEGLGTALVLAANYVSIGYSGGGKLVDAKSIAFSGGAGADHYLELTFTGTLAAQGDKNTNDKFNLQFTVHNSGYTGTVTLTNDYSYNAGATGYDEKITLHDKSDKVIWGTAPGGGTGTGGRGGTPDAAVEDTRGGSGGSRG